MCLSHRQVMSKVYMSNKISPCPGQSDKVLAHPSYVNFDECMMWEQIFALDEGEPYYVCTIHETVTVLYAMPFHGLDAILPGPAHFASISCVQFFSPRSWYLFCDTCSQMKRWRFSVHYRFVYSFSRGFQLIFVHIGKFPS